LYSEQAAKTDGNWRQISKFSAILICKLSNPMMSVMDQRRNIWHFL